MLQERRASPVIERRMVRFSRSMKAVCIRLVRPAAQGGLIGLRCAQADMGVNFHEPFAAVFLDDLGVKQLQIHGPGAAACIGGLYPGAEVGRQRVKVERQAVTGKHRPTLWGQALSDIMDELMSEVLSARAEGEGGDQLGAGVTGDPQPGSFGLASYLEPQLVELQMGQMQ